jgi:hypothetical protein
MVFTSSGPFPTPFVRVEMAAKFRVRPGGFQNYNSEVIITQPPTGAPVKQLGFKPARPDENCFLLHD